MRGELQISAADLSTGRSVVDEVRSWIVATITNPEFGMIALFCAVGLWLTFYFFQFSSFLNTAGT
jgi:hypothetical protein